MTSVMAANGVAAGIHDGMVDVKPHWLSFAQQDLGGLPKTAVNSSAALVEPGAGVGTGVGGFGSARVKLEKIEPADSPLGAADVEGRERGGVSSAGRFEPGFAALLFQNGAKRHPFLEMDSYPSIPIGYEKCFDLQTGCTFYRNPATGMRISPQPEAQVPKEGSIGGRDPVRWDGLELFLERAAVPSSRNSGISNSNELAREERPMMPHDSKHLPRTLAMGNPPMRCPVPTVMNLELTLGLARCHEIVPPTREIRQSYTKDLRLTDSRQQDQQQIKRPKLEQVEETVPSFMGLSHKMGPFPSDFSKVREELLLTSGSESELPRPRTTDLLENCGVSGERLDASRLKPLDYFSLSYCGTGQFVNSVDLGNDPTTTQIARQVPSSMPSARDQAKVSCTLEKIQEALKRSQGQAHPIEGLASSFLPTSNVVATKGNPPTGISTRPRSGKVHPNRGPSPLPRNVSSQRSMSPTTSDASTAASSKSSRHTSTSASVMSFQGEELDDLGAVQTGNHNTNSNSNEPRMSCQSRRGFNEAQVQVQVPTLGQDASTLKTAGCMNCQVFFLLPRRDPTCPKCGSTRLMEVPTISSSGPPQLITPCNLLRSSDGRGTWDDLVRPSATERYAS